MPTPARFLQVDLTNGTCTARPLPDSWRRAWPGGRALGVRLLRDTIHLDPLDPRQTVVFAPGALCGSGAPATNRHVAVFRSPLTGAIADNVDGGPFSLGLQRSGFAAVVITGQSPTPVILDLGSDGARLRHGRAWWGQAADETVARLAVNGAAAAAIGPAGEAGVLFAGLHCGDGNLVGRGGLGAVLGAKGLKALTVTGATDVTVAEPSCFATACDDVLRLFRASPVLLGELGFSIYGTAALIDLVARRGVLAQENFRAVAGGDASAFSGPTLKRSCAPHNFGCCGCPIACKQRTPQGEPLPGFEAIAAFAALPAGRSLAAILHLNQSCNRLGLDPVSTAGTLALYSELRQTTPDINELSRLVGAIAARQGEGAELAGGARRYAIRHGRPELAMTVKGLELAPLDPRGLLGLALAGCVSTDGSSDHAYALLGAELLRKPVPVDRLTLDGKARMVRLVEDTVAAADSLGVCRYALLGAGLEEYAALFAAARGEEWDAVALAEVGARTVLAERSYNQGNGFSRADDRLPERCFAPATTAPPLAAPRLDEELQRYYRLRGLDHTGKVAAGWLEVQP